MRVGGRSGAGDHATHPAVTRDPKDGYPLAYAAVGAADYLVTGAADLLLLEEAIEQFSILTPRAFLHVLER